jgi:hypothetical protein
MTRELAVKINGIISTTLGKKYECYLVDCGDERFEQRIKPLGKSDNLIYYRHKISKIIGISTNYICIIPELKCISIGSFDFELISKQYCITSKL